MQGSVRCDRDKGFREEWMCCARNGEDPKLARPFGQEARTDRSQFDAKEIHNIIASLAMTRLAFDATPEGGYSVEHTVNTGRSVYKVDVIDEHVYE